MSRAKPARESSIPENSIWKIHSCCFVKKGLMLKPLFILAFVPLQLSLGDPVERPKPELLKIDNGTVEIGIDKAMGASITHLSWKALAQNNIVNSSDPGRLIQQSYYAGKRLNRQPAGQHKAWSPWSWNPIQGGGVGSWAKVTRFEKSADKKILTSDTIPKLWDMPNEEAAALMKQGTTFEKGFQNVIVVKNEIICSRKPADAWGPAHPSPQEVPALYFTRNFNVFKSYLGDAQWRLEKQAPGPPWGTTTSPKHAMACFEKSGQGIAIFSPSAVSWNFGPHGHGSSTDLAAGPCSHIAPVARVKLGPQSTLSYRYWLIVGNEKEITKTLDSLWAKYAQERFSITNPK